MSDKSFNVVLSARVDQYTAAMDKAASSTTSMQASAGRDFDKLGGKMQSVGKKMSIGVTLPLVAVGAAAINASADFESSFARMVGLAGVTSDEVDGLKSSVLKLAGETAQAPQDLADALYDASSAGLDTKQAMDAVTLAAKASAVGMGSAKDVVGLVASATASYGADAITASHAVDVLTAAVREGRADPAELASSMGKMLPIASQLGISFDEVSGATAYLSNIFGNTSQTVTALQGFMTKLVSPTQQGRDALAEMGTSVEELHKAIDDNGLMGALELLKSKGFAGNQQALRALFDDIEGYQGALALLNDNSGKLGTTLDAVKGSAGSLDEAFKGVSDTAGFKMKQAWADVQVALIQAGDIIMPIVSGIAGAVADVASAFGDLPAGAQIAVLAIVGVAAAIGPVIGTIGSLVKSVSIAKGAMAAMSMETMATMAGVAAGIGLLVLALSWMTEDSKSTAISAGVFSDALKTATERLGSVEGGMHKVSTAMEDMSPGLKTLGQAVLDALPANDAGSRSDAVRKALGQLGLTVDDTGEAFSKLGGELTLPSARGFLDMTKGFTDAQKEFMAQALLSQKNIGDYGRSLESATGPGKLFTQAQADAAQGLATLRANAADVSLGGIADTFTYSAAAANEFTQGLVAQAKANLEANGIAASGVPLYNEYLRVVSELSPEQQVLATSLADVDAGQKDVAASTAATTAAVVDEKQAAADAKGRLDDLKDGLKNAVSPAEGLKNAADKLASALQVVLGGSMDTETATRNLADGFAQLVDQVTTAREAHDKQAVSLDINTEAGRKNRASIQDQVGSILDLGKAQVETGTSVADATANILGQRDSLIDQLAYLGFSRDAAAEYIDQLGLTPDNISTAIQLLHDQEVKERLQGVLDKLDGIDEGAAAEIQADIDKGDFDAAEARLDQLTKARTVYVRINSDDAHHYAVGTPSAAPGLALVGEKGPELVRFRGGEQVLTNAQTERWAMQGSMAPARVRQSSTTAETTSSGSTVSVTFGDINNTVDMAAAWQQAQFALAAAS